MESSRIRTFERPPTVGGCTADELVIGQPVSLNTLFPGLGLPTDGKVTKIKGANPPDLVEIEMYVAGIYVGTMEIEHRHGQWKAGVAP